MRILALSDLFITKEMMENGFKVFRDLGHEVEIREWKHPDLKALQHDNLLVEQKGADAVELPAGLVDDIGEFDMIVVQFAPLGKEVIARADKAKYIGVLRAGTENISAPAAAAKNVEIIPTPGRNARAVAEFTVGMMLSETRNIARAHAAMKEARFRKDFPNSAAIPEIGGKTVGLIGYGNIGSLVGHFLSAFDCKLLVFDPYLASSPEGVEKVDSLDRLLAEADIVSMHMRLTDDTKHMIAMPQFKQMKKSAYFINTARSGLVNQNDLTKALADGIIMGAAIDVFDKEPVPADDPILQLDNLTLAPHMAGSTIDAFSNSPKLFAERFIKSHLS